MFFQRYNLDLYHSKNCNANLINKINSLSFPLNEFCEVSQGYIPYDKYRGHDEFTIKNRIWHSDICKDETYKKELKGEDIKRYSLNWNGILWVSYGKWLAAPREQKYFVNPRIIITEITRGINYKLSATFTQDEFYNTPSIINIISRNEPAILKSILVIINSRLMSWYHIKVNPKANAETSIPKILVNDVRNLPVSKNLINRADHFIEKAEKMLSLNKELQLLAQKFQRTLQRKFFSDNGFQPIAIAKKIQNWYLLSYPDFIKELTKQKVKLSLSQEAEWEEYFTTEAKKVLALKTEIDATDKAIDKMVYELYGLTEEEINILENS